MRRYSIPCVISLLVAALYNIVDQIFIANASYLGSYGNAANTVVYPVTVIALAAAVMVGDGACAFVSISLGSRKSEQANRAVGSAVVLSLLVSLIITAVCLIFMDPILTAFGGRVNAQTFSLAREYFFWIALGIPFYGFGQAMNPIIRSDGSPRFAMACTMAGCAANLVLDPLFIYGFHWGMMGAAVATVIGQMITAALSVWYLVHMKSMRLERSSFALHLDLAKQYLPLGITSFLSQISLVASMAAVNNMIQATSASDAIFSQQIYSAIPMAVVGIVMKFFQIVISIAVGTAAGCIPLVGYSIGAGRRDRVREMYTRLLVLEAVTGLAATGIAELLPHQLILLFGASGESAVYTQFAVKCFRIYLALMPLSAVNKANFIFLQSLGRARESTLLSLLREVGFGVGLTIALAEWIGLDGVLWSMPAADLLTFAISLFVMRSVYQSLEQPECREALA
jgi:Na+-driven multidrug efflux pump